MKSSNLDGASFSQLPYVLYQKFYIILFIYLLNLYNLNFHISSADFILHLSQSFVCEEYEEASWKM